jgi:hypothetical protein
MDKKLLLHIMISALAKLSLNGLMGGGGGNLKAISQMKSPIFSIPVSKLEGKL